MLREEIAVVPESASRKTSSPRCPASSTGLPPCASAFEASLTTFGLGELALQTGHATPHLAFAKAGPGTAAVKLPLENAETLVSTVWLSGRGR